jgi:hypothetical protein
MINEMRKKLVLASALCATLLAVDANAVPFNGSLAFADGASVVSLGNVDQATSVSMGSASVFLGAGDFLVLNGQTAIPNAPIVLPTASVIPLFTVPTGDLEFDATSVTVTRNALLHTLTLTGFGTFIDTKGVKTRDNTPGEYTATFSKSGSSIGYELTASTLALPDAGYTLMLLGAGLSSLGAFQFRRKGSLVA